MIIFSINKYKTSVYRLGQCISLVPSYSFLICMIFPTQIPHYSKRKHLLTICEICVCVCISCEGQKGWQKRQEKKEQYTLFFPFYLSLKPKSCQDSVPALLYSRREESAIKTALPFSTGWGAISGFGFLLGPEREF